MKNSMDAGSAKVQGAVVLRKTIFGSKTRV